MENLTLNIFEYLRNYYKKFKEYLYGLVKHGRYKTDLLPECFRSQIPKLLYNVYMF